MKLFKLSILGCCIALMTVYCSQKTIKVEYSYEEPQDPSSAEPEEWSKIPQGLNTTFATTNDRFVRSSVPRTKKKILGTGKHGGASGSRHK